MATDVILQTDLPGVNRLNRGKVRDIYEIDGNLLIVATDRISAFDVILPTGIPNKGKVLTGLTEFWLNQIAEASPNHLITTDVAEMPAALQAHADVLRGRSMLCRRAEVFPVECVARGYLAGSGWKSYQADGTVCGIKLPAGLRESDELPEPIFTPATKAESGHDENISFERVIEILGAAAANELRDRTLGLYSRARDFARERGIIICDTKFEWGRTDDGRIILIDEALTPDSSRFWPADQYEPGRSQASFDKQFVRDWLETCDWDKTPPAPDLPADVVARTSEKYMQAYEILTGKPLGDAA